MDFKEQFVKYVNANLDSDIALMSIIGMFGKGIKYYILGYIGARQYLCVWLSDSSWGVCTVVHNLLQEESYDLIQLNEEEPDIVTLGELCNYICENYY